MTRCETFVSHQTFPGYTEHDCSFDFHRPKFRLWWMEAATAARAEGVEGCRGREVDGKFAHGRRMRVRINRTRQGRRMAARKYGIREVFATLQGEGAQAG